MLCLKKKLDLKMDIYERLPKDRLTIPETHRTAASLSHEKLDFHQTRLSIVGQEKTGFILVSYDGYGHKGIKRTYIDTYDPKTKILRPTYKHGSVMTCVNASISENHTLLAFTIIQTATESDNERIAKLTPSGVIPKQKSAPAVNPSKDHVVFQSYIAEVREGGMMYKLSIKNPDVQKVQFLYTEKSRIVYLLFFLEGSFVHLYQVPIRQHKKGVEITTQPNLVSIVVKHHIWSEWDANKNSLYVLQKNLIDQPEELRSSNNNNLNNNNNNNSNNNNNTISIGNMNSVSNMKQEKRTKQYILKLYHIPDRSFKQIWEIPLKMNLHYSSFSKKMESYYYGVDHRAANPISRYMHIVQLDGNAYCLCQQHQAEEESTSIKLSIYLLHSKEKIDINIPMNNLEKRFIQNTRVFFGSIASMLLIYVPNVYFQLLDCGAEHTPSLGLSLRGYPESATALPGSEYPKDADILIHYPTNTDPSAPKGHCFLDSRTGIAYEYLLDREHILHLLSITNSTDIQSQIIHLVICHLKDEELLEQIMTCICSSYPEHLSTSLLKEFLIGSVYMSIKNSQNSNANLLSILPISSIPPFKYQIRRDKYNELTGYYVLPSFNLIIKDREQLKLAPRFQHDLLVNCSDRYMEVQGINNNTSKLQSFFRTLLTSSNSREDLEGGNPMLEEDFDSTLYRPSKQLVEAIVNHITSCYPKIIKPQAIPLASYYRRKIVATTNRLFKYIMDHFDREKAKIVLFQALETLYCTLEELSYPCPKGFSYEFVTLGETCLRRNVFLQYVERGVFRLNDEFIKNTINKLNNEDSNDLLFKYELLCNYQNRKKCFEIMREHNEYVEYLLQYYLSNLPLSAPSREELNGPVNLERTNESPFIPRSVFLNAIISYYDRNEYQLIVSFINQNRNQLHTSVLLLIKSMKEIKEKKGKNKDREKDKEKLNENEKEKDDKEKDGNSSTSSSNNENNLNNYSHYTDDDSTDYFSHLGN